MGYSPTLGFVFAFDSTKMEDLLSLWKETNEQRGLNIEHQVDLVCILKKGLLFHADPEGTIDCPPKPESQLKYGEYVPEGNLRTFYELIMHVLTQFWMRPIRILSCFSYE